MLPAGPTMPQVTPAGQVPGQQNPDALGPQAGTPYGQIQDPLAYDHPLRPLVGLWIEKLRLAQEHKREKFGKDAAEGMAFFNGPYDFLYQKKYAGTSPGFTLNDDEEEIPAPSFQMTVNKVAEAVQIFGPVLYHRNPNRQVNPREVPEIPPEFFGDPTNPMAAEQFAMMQGQQSALRAVDKLRSLLLEFYLNYTPTELNLKEHCRRAIDETIIKGMGLLWTELYTPPGTPPRPDGSRLTLVGSFQDSVDHLLIDPDAETIEDARWIARRRIQPSWLVERDYGLPVGQLKGVAESLDRQSEVNTSAEGDYQRTLGATADLVVYWQVWSKMGVGGRFSGMSDSQRAVLDQFGDYCYLVVCDGVPYPLNLPPEVIASADPSAAEEVLSRLDWPIPFWAADEWPFTPIYFHGIPRCPWPMSHLKPAMGELKFLQWAYSFIAGKMRNTCRDFVAIKKSVGEEMKEAILHGKDLTLLEIEEAHGGTIAEVVSFLQHPQMNGDMWKVIEAVTANFERRTGLTELMYGQSEAQMRSAEEANVKGSQLQVRPDDMAQKVEDAMTSVARKEAIAARWHLTGQDVSVAMGPVAAQFWDQVVRTADLFEMCRQLDYRIEANSTKKPNQARDAANMASAMQTLFAPLFQYAGASGNVQPVNALISDWAKSIGMDPTDYLLAAPPPQPAAPAGAGGPPGPGGGGPQQQGPQGQQQQPQQQPQGGQRQPQRRGGVK